MARDAKAQRLCTAPIDICCLKTPSGIVRMELSCPDAGEFPLKLPEDFMASEHLPDALLPTETATLAQAYAVALSYFGGSYPLAAADRRCLARLTVMAGCVRRQRDDDLASIVDAHAIAAEVVDFFMVLDASGIRS